MKHFMVALIAALTLMTSQASTSSRPGKTTTTDGQVRTAIKGESVHANIPRIPRYKILRSNPHKITHKILDGKVSDFIDDDELMSPYLRRDLIKIEHSEGLSDLVLWKLFLARQQALAKYREKFG